MASKMIKCKTCGKEIGKAAKVCPHCGSKNKQPIFKKWWFWVLALLVVLLIAGGGEADTPDTPSSGSTQSGQSSGNPTTQTTPAVKTTYQVGDELVDGSLKIVYMSSGVHVEENDFLQPKEGYKYIYLQFAFENLSTSIDQSVTSASFECYADGYAAEAYYGGEDPLSATLSPSRATSGYIYFSVPEDATSIEVEYDTNLFTSKKIDFIYEGEKVSGYTLPTTAQSTPGAIPVGGTADSSNLKITYLDCQEYISDNMFVQPKDGFHFISCTLEFENTGKSDAYISSWDFDCYADGVACTATYIREDDLSATLSAGRKTKGTVTFEVPLDATVVEVEYLTNYFTSKRVVFTVK